jgi:Ca-activated chloride channel homolog
VSVSNVSFSAIALCLLSVAAPGAAQESPPAPSDSSRSQSQSVAIAGPTFRTGVELVALTVTVTDVDRGLVSGLSADDFQVFEDGVQQPVTFFGMATVPLDLALLVDGSASMRNTLPLAREAAAGLLETLRPGDRASLVEFRNTVRVTQTQTAETASVVTALNAMTASGGTSLYNALYVTLRDFQLQARDDGDIRRRAIVVLSDGEDTGSLIGFDEVLDLARRSGVTIYAVALKDQAQIARQRAQQNGRRFLSRADYAMRALAEETGARAFFPDAPTDLQSVYDSIAAELASQYALGYVSRNPVRNGAWRRLLVRIANATKIRPRTRAGYFAEATRQR